MWVAGFKKNVMKNVWNLQGQHLWSCCFDLNLFSKDQYGQESDRISKEHTLFPLRYKSLLVFQLKCLNVTQRRQQEGLC